MKATDTFRNPLYRHNCAQAIAYKWHKLYPQDLDVVGDYARYIGGSAPGGLCGALFAAMQACPERAEELKQRFADRIGAVCCKDIKGVGRVPCPVCVDTADKILEDIDKESRES